MICGGRFKKSSLHEWWFLSNGRRVDEMVELSWEGWAVKIEDIILGFAHVHYFIESFWGWFIITLKRVQVVNDGERWFEIGGEVDGVG